MNDQSETTYTDINGYTSETFASHNKSALAAARRAEVLALRQQALRTSRTVESAAFRTLARERGGVNARNREAIEAEAKAAGRHAAEALYLSKGYTHCSDPFGFECKRLASPGYGSCPFCTMKD